MRRENAFVNSTLFSVLFTMFLVYHDLKQKIKQDVLMPRRNLRESEKYIWIIQNVYENSRFFYITESHATRHSAVSAFTEAVEFLERSLASMRMRYCCRMIGFFSRHNRFAEMHSHLQLSYHITDRLLAAGNNNYWLHENWQFPMLSYRAVNTYIIFLVLWSRFITYY